MKSIFVAILLMASVSIPPMANAQTSPKQQCAVSQGNWTGATTESCQIAPGSGSDHNNTAPQHAAVT